MPYICKTGMAMLFNKVVNTGQDTAIDCSVKPLILLDTFRIHSVTHGTQNRQHRQKEVRLSFQTRKGRRCTSAHGVKRGGRGAVTLIHNKKVSFIIKNNSIFFTTWVIVLVILLTSNNNIVITNLISEIWEHIYDDIRQVTKHEWSEDHTDLLAS